MMLDVFGSAFYKKGTSTCTTSGNSGTMAYVRTYSDCGLTDFRDCGMKEGGHYVVNICEFYWRSFFDAAERVGTIVHESSHHFGSDDNGYCHSVDCPNLPSQLARNNADSYTEFIKELVEDDSLGE